MPGSYRSIIVVLAVLLLSSCYSDATSPVAVEIVEVFPGVLILAIGEQQTLTATPKAGDVALTGRTITWSSSASDRAMVDQAGNVTGVRGGSASITATSEGKSGSANVTVNNPAPQTASLAPNSLQAGGAAFTLTVSGSLFVNESVVRWNGSNRTTSFVSATQLTASITAVDIAAATTAQVTVFTPTPGGGTSTALEFLVTPMPNPVPVLTMIAPDNAIAGGAAFTLVATGSAFMAESQLQWNGASRTTTFNSATQLSASISAADIAAVAVAQVAVFTPAPGGGTSAQLPFTIVAPNPVPTATTLVPNTAVEGSAAFTLTVNGTGFVAGAEVRWNGAARATTFVSATQVTAAIPASDVAAIAVAQVTVFNPAPGGGLSGQLAFSITSLAPTVITVNTLADPVPMEESGPFNADFDGVQCTLRQAIQAANTNLPVAACGAGSDAFIDEIVFHPSLVGTIILTSDLPAFEDDTKMDGSFRVGISGDDSFRGFQIGDGVIFQLASFSVRNTVAASGAAVLNNGGTLTFNDVSLSSSQATLGFGGAIANNSGTVNLINCALSFNSAVIAGGAIMNFAAGTMNISGGIITNNTAGTGAGIENDGVMTLTEVTLRLATAIGNGGGIFNFGGLLTVQRSLIHTNAAGGGGGGIFNSFGNVTIVNSTITANSASGLAGFVGAAINNFGGSVSLFNATVVRSLSPGGTGAVHSSDGGTLNLTNTLIASQITGDDCSGVLAEFVTGGHNLSSDATCNLTHLNDIPASIPGLDVFLTNNGGLTLTHKLLAGSAAINAGNPAVCNGILVNGVDQRGQSRAGLFCDIGAFEEVDLAESPLWALAPPFRATEARGSLLLSPTAGPRRPHTPYPIPYTQKKGAGLGASTLSGSATTAVIGTLRPTERRRASFPSYCITDE
jgi:hypothetical protein